MKLNLTVSNRLVDILQQKGAALQDAANAAVVRQTNETHGEMRVQIAQRLSPRAGNALRQVRKTNPAAPNAEAEVVGFIHSAWWRKNRKGGPDIDMFAAYARGDVIRPVNAKYLVMPLPAAYAVTGIPRGGRGSRQKPTPVLVEAALDTDLFVLRRPGGKNATLAASTLEQTTRGGTKQFIAGRYRTKRGSIARRRGVRTVVPFFVLLKNTRVPKRLDFSGIEAKKAKGLAEKFVVELARRERS